VTDHRSQQDFSVPKVALCDLRKNRVNPPFKQKEKSAEPSAKLPATLTPHNLPPEEEETTAEKARGQRTDHETISPLMRMHSTQGVQSAISIIDKAHISFQC
jgi:hypothetical protein